MNFYHTKQRTVYYKEPVTLEEFKEILKSKPIHLYCKEWSNKSVYITITYNKNNTVRIHKHPLTSANPYTMTLEEFYEDVKNEMCSLTTEL
jgi:hypothetical protein